MLHILDIMRKSFLRETCNNNNNNNKNNNNNNNAGNISAEIMTLKTLNQKKSNNKKKWTLKFFYRNNKFLTPTLRRMLGNALIDLHFDYACSTWYPNLDEKLKK